MDGVPRAQGLAAAVRLRRAEVLRLADDVLEAAAVTVVQPPTPGSVMVELEQAVGAFCLAEVVVTEARVALHGTQGWASVMGFDETGALAAAVLDVAAARSGPLSDAIDALCDEALRAEAELAAAELLAVAATEVAPG